MDGQEHLLHAIWSVPLWVSKSFMGDIVNEMLGFSLPRMNEKPIVVGRIFLVLLNSYTEAPSEAAFWR